MGEETALHSLRREYAAMPPVAAMQVRVEGMEGGRLRLSAPLAANVNDKGTAFGGSLVSLMTLAGWGLVAMRLERAGVAAEVYVADSQVRYLAPLRSDLHASAALDEGQSWDEFLRTLAQRGRARVQLRAEVALPEGGVAATLSGRFVALAKEAPAPG
ncbi:YiiD C-terminal domain-containing protein [Pseudoxanthomonas mexicana]|uniref:YiiD C-terminal domain-containing protein n=1 Tax=Pseudoxanthomonas mexicana TaxID=128785 RepID=UPI00398B4416